MQPKHHVSAAIAHLRLHVAMMSFVIIAALVVQLLVFGFVHFTDARWEKVDSTPPSQNLSVVSTGSQSPDAGKALTDESGQSIQRRTKTLEEIQAAESEMVLSKWNFMMGQFSGLAVTLGVVASITLGLVTILGVVIAGGASVPGVEKAVTACVWSLVLALLTLPWRDAFASMPFAGVFGGYEQMVAASEAVAAGTRSSVSLFATHLLMPLAALGVVAIIAARFWSGVSHGVIVTSVSQLDEAVDREITGIRSRGVTSNIGPRTVGVMNQAAGDSPNGNGHKPLPQSVPADEDAPGRLI